MKKPKKLPNHPDPTIKIISNSELTIVVLTYLASIYLPAIFPNISTDRNHCYGFIFLLSLFFISRTWFSTDLKGRNYLKFIIISAILIGSWNVFKNTKESFDQKDEKQIQEMADIAADNFGITIVAASNNDFKEAKIILKNGSSVSIVQEGSNYDFEAISYGSLKSPANNFEMPLKIAKGTNELLEPNQSVTIDSGISNYFSEIDKAYRSILAGEIIRHSHFFYGKGLAPDIPDHGITFTRDQEKSISIILRIKFDFYLFGNPRISRIKYFYFKTKFDGSNYEWVPSD